jgi:hypothetical protein
MLGPPKVPGVRHRMTDRHANPTRYSPAALALFAEYAECRSQYRPLECNASPACWVRDGPPALTSNGSRHGSSRCLGCGGGPKVPRTGRLPR